MVQHEPEGLSLLVTDGADTSAFDGDVPTLRVHTTPPVVFTVEDVPEIEASPYDFSSEPAPPHSAPHNTGAADHVIPTTDTRSNTLDPSTTAYHGTSLASQGSATDAGDAAQWATSTTFDTLRGGR